MGFYGTVLFCRYIFSFPSCRRLFPYGTYKAARGVSAFQLKEWLGHSSITTSQIYVHLATQDGRKQMEATSL